MNFSFVYHPVVVTANGEKDRKKVRKRVISILKALPRHARVVAMDWMMDVLVVALLKFVW